MSFSRATRFDTSNNKTEGSVLPNPPSDEKPLSSKGIRSKDRTDQPSAPSSKPNSRPTSRMEPKRSTPSDIALDGPMKSQSSDLSLRKDTTSNIPLRKKQPQKPAKVVSKFNPTTATTTTTPSSTPRTNSNMANARATANTRTSLEIQFTTKKRKLDQLKKELNEKQKPVLEIYDSLLEIKKKLEITGKFVQIENIKLIDYNNNILKSRTQSPARSLPQLDPSAGGEIKKNEASEEVLKNMKNILVNIPDTFLQLCKSMIEKRNSLIETMEKSMNAEDASAENSIKALKLETLQLQNKIQEIQKQQEKKIADISADWQSLLEQSDAPLLSDQHVKQLESQIKAQENTIAEYASKIKQLEHSSHTTFSSEKHKLEEKIASLNDTIKQLEKELEQEKRLVKEQIAKFDKLKNMKSKAELSEAKTKEYEAKISDLQKKNRLIQDQSRTREIQWQKEKDELQRSVKAQEAVLHKMTADRNHYETRLKAADEVMSEREKKSKEIIEKLKTEVEESRKAMIDAKTEKETLQSKLEGLEEEFIKKDVRNKQSLDVAGNRDISAFLDGMGCKEKELYAQLIETKSTLKEYEEKIKAFEMEKLRFIDTIEQMSGTDGKEANLGAALVKKQEEISKYEQLLYQFETKAGEKTLENENLKAEIRALSMKLEVLERESNQNLPQDLKKMVSDSRSKLNDVLKRSLDNEQKIIQYEHEVDKQSKHISKMENLLKVRDSFIGMLKAKKDDLLVENESLTRYSEELRALMFEVKDDLKLRTEMVQELTNNLDMKEKTCAKLEKKIKELEGLLSLTNEKRFKLQDTLGSVERELQSTKAHINQMSDLHTRYDSGMNIMNQLPIEIIEYNESLFLPRPIKVVCEGCTSNHDYQNEPAEIPVHIKSSKSNHINTQTFVPNYDTEYSEDQVVRVIDYTNNMRNALHVPFNCGDKTSNPRIQTSNYYNNVKMSNYDSIGTITSDLLQSSHNSTQTMSLNDQFTNTSIPTSNNTTQCCNCTEIGTHPMQPRTRKLYTEAVCDCDDIIEERITFNEPHNMNQYPLYSHYHNIPQNTHCKYFNPQPSPFEPTAYHGDHNYIRPVAFYPNHYGAVPLQYTKKSHVSKNFTFQNPNGRTTVNLLTSHETVAQSLHKIRNDLERSLDIVQKNVCKLT